MGRGFSNSLLFQVNQSSQRMATLVAITIGSTTYYMTDYGEDITDTNGRTYTSSANIIEIGDVSETGALKVNELSLELSGANQVFIAAFLQNDYIDKQVVIKRAYLDSLDDVIDSFVFFNGRIVSFAIEDDERESKLTVNIASHWADFEKIKNRRTNLNSQQVYFPNDLGFEYASKITKDLRWGRKG